MGSRNANHRLEKADQSFHINEFKQRFVMQLGTFAISMYLFSASSALAQNSCWGCMGPPIGGGGGGGYPSTYSSENEGYPPLRDDRIRKYSSCRTTEAVGANACEVAGSLESSLSNCLTAAQAACLDANGDFLIKDNKRYSTFTVLPGEGVSGYTFQSYACDYPPGHVPQSILSSGAPADTPRSAPNNNGGIGEGFPPLESERLRSYGSCFASEPGASEACEAATNLQLQVDDCIRSARAMCLELNGNFSNLQSSAFFLGFPQGKNLQEGYAYQRYACDYPKDSVPIGTKVQDVYGNILLNPLPPGRLPTGYPLELMPAPGPLPSSTMPGTGGQPMPPAAPAHAIDSGDTAVDGATAPE